MGVLILAAACSAGGPGTSSVSIDRTHAVPILAGETHPTGTPLGEGFSVPRGAVLVGPVLPVDAPISVSGVTPQSTWAATLVVDGEPLAVYDALVQQAIDHGIEGIPWSDLGCVRGPDAAQCSGQSRIAARGLLLFIGLTAKKSCGVWHSDLSISVSDFGGPQANLVQTARPAIKPAPKIPRHPDETIPGPGVEIEIERSYSGPGEYRASKIPIVNGSQPLLAFSRKVCFDAGRSALMRATAPDRVFDTYSRNARRLKVWDDPAPPVRHERRGAWNSRSVAYSNTDTSVTIELFTSRRAPERSYLRLGIGNGA